MTSQRRTSKKSLSMEKVAGGVALLLGLSLVLSGALQRSCFAQGTGITASMTGTVTDPAGAVVAGATIKALNVSTNAVRTIATSTNGDYVITQLPPGLYGLTIDKSGFETYEQNGIILTIGQIAQINVQLQIGSQQQRVTVSAEPPAIQTQSSSVGLLVDAATIVNTPLNGRLSVIGLVALAPGTQNNQPQDQLPTGGITPEIGTGGNSSGYGLIGDTLDGAVNTEVTLGRGEAEVPPLDGIAEFRAITSGAPAEFEQPAQVTVVTKSGTNQFHGMILEFNRVAATAAKTYSFSGPVVKPQYIRNEYGGNFSGPVMIPKIYSGKDRSFFFFNFEQFRLDQAVDRNTQMPTAAERSGNFTGVGTIIDPLTGIPFTGDQIPSGRINTVDVQLQNILFPLPTTPGTGVNTYQFIPYVNTATRYALRMDQKLTSRDQLRGTFLRAEYGPNPSPGTTSNYGGLAQTGEVNTNTILGWTHIFAPTLLLDTGVSYLHLPIYRTPQLHNVDFSSIIPGLGPELIEGAPTISIQNITGVSEAGSKDLEQDFQFFTTLTKVLATHTIKAGFNWIYNNHWEDGVSSPQRGSYTFTGQYSSVGYADFLLGYPSATVLPIPNNAVTRNLSSQYGMFIQDDWRITPRLTLNYGIRYDLQWFLDNPYGTNALFVPSLGKVVAFNTHYTAAAIPALLSFPVVLAPQVNIASNEWNYLGQDTNNVGPRFGFAYQLRPNTTVLRGAFGIYYQPLSASYIDLDSNENIPYFTSETFEQPTGKPTITMYAPFASTGAFSANPTAITLYRPTTDPYTEMYNLAIEHELPKQVTVRIGYVGQRNLKQNNGYGVGPDLNQPQPAPGAVQPLRPYQPFSTMIGNGFPIFHTSMNALQIGVHKQYSSGFMINAEYMWSRILGTENLENPNGTTPNDSYGVIGGTTPQTLAVSYSYLLPFGEGQLLLSGVNTIVNKVVSGWQLSGITTWHDGEPFSVSFSSSVVGSPSGRANRVTGVPVYPAHKTLAEWFNPAAFTAPPVYTFGNSGYDMLRGPNYQNWDMSLEKNVRWHERYNLKLRADAFNAFNHPNFAGPSASISNPASVGKITSTTGENRTVEFAGKLSF